MIAATAGVELVTLDTTDPGQVRPALAEDSTGPSWSSPEVGRHGRDRLASPGATTQAFTDAGIDDASRIVVVTDPASPLAQFGR